MTFCSDNQNKSEMINKIEYNKNESSYKIYYLDGTYTSFNNFDEEYVKKIEEKMINQAIERDLYLTNYNNKKIPFLLLSILSAILLGRCISREEIFPIMIAIFTTLYYSYSYLNNNDKIKELKKYRILLDNYKEFKENPNIARVIEFEPIYCDPLDITSIDKYSLNDVKKMYKKLKKDKENQEC